MSKWKKVTFKNAPLEIIDGDRGTNYPKQSDFLTSGYCLFLNAGNVTREGFSFSNCTFISQEKDSILRKGKLKKYDTILTTRGTVGNVAFFDDSVQFKNIRINSGMVILRPKPENLDPRYLYLFVRSADFQEQLLAMLSGSAQPQLPIRDINQIVISLPPLPEQKAIAHILGSLDDKIELNRRMNETLEAMARAIFKDWFVDFGPTRAKIEGRAPYLPEPIWSLFPDAIDPLSGLPVGWEVSTIGEEVKVVGGSTPNTKNPNFWNGGIPWVTPKDLSNLNTPVLLETARTITKDGLAKISSGLLPVGTVLLSSRAPVGYLAISEIPIAVNQGFIAMVCERRLSNIFILLWAKENMDVIIQNANGSTFQEISKRNFRPINVVVASPQVLDNFHQNICPLYQRIVSNEIESRTLAELRDRLLPKLMSGQIRVKDAEKLVEEVL